MGCSGVQNYTGQQYVWDPESRLSQVWAEHNSNTYYQSATYSYDAQGNRIRADQYVPGAQAGQSVPSTFREYSFFDGQMLAEKDQTGAWTDYIYANGSRVARVDNQKQLFHIHGVRDSSVHMEWGVEGPIQGVPANVIGLTIQPGDRLAFTTMQNLPMYGGIGLVFQDGTGTGAMTDMQTGTPMWVNGTSDQAWHHLVGSLDAYQGKTVASVYVGIHNQAPAETFDVWVDNLAIYRADGSVLPIFTGGQSLFAPNLSGSPGGARNMSNGTTVGTVDDKTATSFYASDHLGTTQVELAGGGWPISRSEFAPFGQELDTSYSVNRYKFTGKERDAESGLDYFGARYYASSMGRMMSPDWSNDPAPVPFALLGNPQSLNLYAYTSNNPVGLKDADGHKVGGADFDRRAHGGGFGDVSGSVEPTYTDPTAAFMYAHGFAMAAEEVQQNASKAQQQNESVSATGQQNSTNSSGHPIDKDAIANYADQHAEKGSLGKCAAYCRRAFEAGGVDTSGHPIDAKDWGPTLLKNGATVISPDGYTPSKADVAVFNGSDAHPHGHIAVYDGKQWVSDFKQRNMSPYRTGAPPVTIYRFPDN